MSSTPRPSLERQKSGSSTPSLVVTLKVSRNKLMTAAESVSLNTENSPAQTAEDDARSRQGSSNSPAPSATAPAAVIATSASKGDNAQESGPATPANGEASTPTVMGPPVDGPKKRAGKRGADGMADGPKSRAKPGPKKRAKLDDGTTDGAGRNVGGAGHKAGPRGNQGAINAGLRALDRSGTPCRKWAIGGFKIKTFTGVEWEIKRWTAPPKTVPESSTASSAAASTEGSTKETNGNGQVKSEANNSRNGEPVTAMPQIDTVMSDVPKINTHESTNIPIATAS